MKVRSSSFFSSAAISIGIVIRETTTAENCGVCVVGFIDAPTSDGRMLVKAIVTVWPIPWMLIGPFVKVSGTLFGSHGTGAIMCCCIDMVISSTFGETVHVRR